MVTTMAVPSNLTEYVNRLSALRARLSAKRGGDQGVILDEMTDLYEYIRQNTGAIAVETTEIFHGGFVDYNDAATAGTPINVLAATPTVLTNDAAGGFTNIAYLPSDMTGIWDEVNDEFDWTELKLGDMVDIRLDLEVTTTVPNQEVDIYLRLAQGTGNEYNIPFISAQQFKNAAAHPLNRFNGIYMGDTNTLNNPAQFMIESPDAATVVVNGWYCKLIRRGAIV